VTEAGDRGQHHPPAPGPAPAHPDVSVHRPPEGRPDRHPVDPGHYRVRHDKIDDSGVITLRHNSRLHHIGLGRRHAGTRVLMLAHDLHIRVLTEHGQLLRDLLLDPSRDYQPQPKP
jgi:hypothetical protein